MKSQRAIVLWFTRLDEWDVYTVGSGNISPKLNYADKYMNRIDRLFATLLLLQSKKRIRSQELAQRFGISRRTVYRDMAALMEMGVPIVSLPGEGYEMMPGFYLPPLLFTPDEAGAVFGISMGMPFVRSGAKNPSKLYWTESFLGKTSNCLAPQGCFGRPQHDC